MSLFQSFPILVPGAEKSSNVVKVVSPYDLSEIGEVETGGSDVVDLALRNAEQVFADRSQWLSGEKRIAVLERLVTLIEERQDAIAVEAAREGGKPLVDSRVEVARAIDGIKYTICALRTESGVEIPMGLTKSSENRIAFTTKEPIGVVVAVSAFNHPVNLIVHQIIPAIALGCPVIVKPATDTPLSCMTLVQLVREAGLPEKWCQGIVTSDRDSATKLVCDPRVAFFSFIGSGEVGWSLKSQLAPGTRCALEHGGVAPVVIAKDADLEDALPLLTKGGFYHAGQVCVSVQRIYAHKSIAASLAERLSENAQKLHVGDPTKEDTEVGPLIRPKEVTRVESWVNQAIEEGATLLCGGKKLNDTCYQPTVLLDPSDESLVSTGEVFGPVVCVYSFEDIDDAISRANSLPFSFQAAVFTSSIDTAMYVQSRISAATVMVNDHTAFRVDWMPFAGHKQSGYGTGGIPFTMEDMCSEKLIVIRSKAL
jgi:acyl-CoA reductase-like NAD-dependent aldehyde dehydrogenase